METKNNNHSSLSPNWLWGSVLIVLGGAALLGQLMPGWFGGLVWAALFAGSGAVFFTVYLGDRQRWWALIPGYILVIIGAIILFGTSNFPGEFIGTFVMFAIAAPFIYVYLLNREQNWWALIPAYAMSVIGLIVATSSVLPGLMIGSWIMFAIAAPFIYVYLRNHEHWWALIPAYAMSAIGVLVAVSSFIPGPVIGAYVLFAIALPFIYVYLRNHEHWWALIPAGIMSVIGAGLLIAGIQEIVPVTLIIPVALIVAGIFLLGRQVAGDKPGIEVKTGPGADKPPSG
jgi:hypothetical protein